MAIGSLRMKHSHGQCDQKGRLRPKCTSSGSLGSVYRLVRGDGEPPQVRNRESHVHGSDWGYIRQQHARRPALTKPSLFPSLCGDAGSELWSEGNRA